MRNVFRVSEEKRPSPTLKFIARGVAALALIGSTLPAGAEIVFTVPPRENAQQAALTYDPVVQFLSRTLNQRVVFKHPRNWVIYLDMLVKDQADLYFSEPHSVGFQLSHHKHRLLLRGPNDQWLVVARKGSDFRFAGRSACLLPPPDFGHMLFNRQAEFINNPSYTAHIVTVSLYEDAVIGLIGNQCQYTAVPQYFYSLFPEAYKDQLDERVLKTTPGQAFTVSSRMSEKLADTLRAALLSDEGQQAMKNLRDRFMNGELLTTATDLKPYFVQSEGLVEGYLKPLRLLRP